jgi:predicted nucleic acid-binding protein
MECLLELARDLSAGGGWELGYPEARRQDAKIFKDRAGGEKVEELLSKAAEAKRPQLMPVVNWGEAYYAIWRAHGEQAANTKLQETAQLPVALIDVDAELARLAASLKAQHNPLYADCFAAALAQTRKAALVTTDKDFECVASVLKILWI